MRLIDGIEPPTRGSAIHSSERHANCAYREESSRVVPITTPAPVTGAGVGPRLSTWL
jgi:hypothetical protein